jgi:hypothetical protein
VLLEALSDNFTDITGLGINTGKFNKGTDSNPKPSKYKAVSLVFA